MPASVTEQAKQVRKQHQRVRHRQFMAYRRKGSVLITRRDDDATAVSRIIRFMNIRDE